MYASDLKKLVNEWPAFSRLLTGIFSADTIPNFIDVDHFAIVNTDTKEKKGSHWWIFIRRDIDFIELFDSLGSSHPEAKLLEKFDCYIEQNKQQYQANSSSNCGLFCLYFIAHRYMNYQESFSELLENIFTDNKDKNEKLVLNFFA
jgi:hypothetical protein